ncbi:MAG: FecR domain-containing protein [Candidatus Neomarinimicrobiota bacterium]
MMRKLLFLVTVTSGLLAVDRIALTMKTSGQVSHKGEQVPDFQTLRRGSSLFDGDFVVTGDDGLAIALFLDDKSQLKIRQNTETRIAGSRTEGVISKRVELSYGTLKATVKEQTQQFTITTPTSVASIKGTELWVLTDPDSGDIIISLEGAIELTNLISGSVHSVVPGTVVESNADGKIEVLATVKVRGEASSGISAGRFTLSGISVLGGGVSAQDLSDTVEVTGGTVFEGTDVKAGAVITLTGILDEQTGNVEATLIEVSERVTIRGIVSSTFTGNRFPISDVTVVEGDRETLPAEVKITEGTVIEGDDIIYGAEVTVVGIFNRETEVLEATQMIVVIPKLRITGLITAVSEEGLVELSEIEVKVGEIEASALSGRVIVTGSTVIEVDELTVGLKVTVVGTLDEETGDIVAERIRLPQVVLLATVNSPVVNEQFEITDITVQEGDLDPSTLSGIVKLGPDTEIEGGEITTGLRVTVTGSVEKETGAFLATAVMVIVAERELIFDMEDNHGRRKELIIKFQ